MTVGQLIEELQKLPQDVEVGKYTIPTYGEGWDPLIRVEVNYKGEVELYFY